jgi:ParB/RepB/Spo0J family partition protein
MFPPDPNTIVDIPLTQIVAVEGWNCRSGKWELNDGDDNSQQFDDLVASIREKGQEEPCDVRIHSAEDGTYLLIAGFRRHKAAQRIATEDNNPNATLRCIVRSYDSVQARIRNIAENAGRQNISTPDLAWGIYELHKAALTNGRPMTAAQIGAVIGKSQGHVGQLLNIMIKCKPTITRKWRVIPKAVSVASMYALAMLPKAEQDAAFAALLAPMEAKKSPETESVRQRTWVDAAKTKAYSEGVLLGQLEAAGLITTTRLDFGQHIDLIVPLREGCLPVQRDAIAAQAMKGFKMGLRRERIPKSEEP